MNIEDLGNVFQAFANEINGLTSQVSNVNTSIGLLGSALVVPPYSGDPKGFQNWIKCIEKQAMLDGLNDDAIKRLTFRSSKGAVSDFIQRFLQDNPQENWETLKQELTSRFAEVTDQMHAFTLLRQVKQNSDENVQIYAERLLMLGKESFPPGTDRLTIERQLIGFFIDGLLNDGLKIKLMRDNPATFQAAVQTALQEQNLRKRFNLRTSHAHHESHSGTPMEVDHMRFKRGPRDQGNSRGTANVHAVDNNDSEQQENKTYDRRKITCFNCGKKGHIKRNCWFLNKTSEN